MTMIRSLRWKDLASTLRVMPSASAEDARRRDAARPEFLESVSEGPGPVLGAFPKAFR